MARLVRPDRRARTANEAPLDRPGLRGQPAAGEQPGRPARMVKMARLVRLVQREPPEQRGRPAQRVLPDQLGLRDQLVPLGRRVITRPCLDLPDQLDRRVRDQPVLPVQRVQSEPLDQLGRRDRRVRKEFRA
jgi:hypothetical protein